MTRTHPERAVPLSARKPRATRPGAGPPRVPTPGVLPPGRMAELQELADQIAREHEDTLDATKGRRELLGAAVGARRQDLDELTRRAENRAWDAAIRDGLADLTTPAASAA